MLCGNIACDIAHDTILLHQPLEQNVLFCSMVHRLAVIYTHLNHCTVIEKQKLKSEVICKIETAE